MIIVVQHSKKGTNREKTQEELTIVDNNWLLVIIAQFIERFIHALLGALKNTHTHTSSHTHIVLRWDSGRERDRDKAGAS